jgi:hypothetical protein
VNFAFAGIVALSAANTGVAAGVDQSSEMPATTKPALICIYRLLKSDAEIQSVEAYRVDGFRFALEYVFKDKDGRLVTSDIVLSGVSDNNNAYEVSIPDNKPDYMGWESVEFLSKRFPQLDTTCRVSSAFDNLIPYPKPRAEWVRVDLKR